MPVVTLLALAVLLALVPVTLLVPGLGELVMRTHGGTRFDAHLFMAVNTATGILAVPLAMRLLRRSPDVRRWIVLALLGDAVAFGLMALAPTLGALLVARALEGAMHLPAIALLMVAVARSGTRRGRAMGLMGAGLMGGVTVGGALGGLLVERGPGTVYATGAGLLVVAALLVAIVRVPAVTPALAASAPGGPRSSRGWLALAYSFVERASIGVFVSTFPLFVAEVHGLRPAERGRLIALFMLPLVALMVPFGWLVERVGARVPLAAGMAAFGLLFGAYGAVDVRALQVLMVLSGIASAAMFAALLVLVAEAAEQEGRERIYGDFHVTGALGFLAGPLLGGALVELTRASSGTPGYAGIFLGAGGAIVALALLAWRMLPSRAAGDAGGRAATTSLG